MFILRKEHEEAFSKASYMRFRKRAALYLRETYPARLKAVIDEELDNIVMAGCERARGYGLKTERQMIRFLRTIILLKDSLDQDSPHKDIIHLLERSSKSPEDRSKKILDIARQRGAKTKE